VAHNESRAAAAKKAAKNGNIESNESVAAAAWRNVINGAASNKGGEAS